MREINGGDGSREPASRDAGALAGLVVADFSRVLAGPLVSQILGDLGADVIKIERPGVGDDTRMWGPPWSGEDSTYYLGLNRNKRSIALDLTDPDDLAVARQIAGRADVLIENFRPGIMDRYRLAYGDLAPGNMRLVYCTITGFGSTTEGSGLGGYDFLVQAMSGLMSITGPPDGEPTKVGVALVDKITGLYATIAILAALSARDRNGSGQHVEVSLMGSALASLVNAASGWLNAGFQPSPAGNRHPSIAPYQTYRAADRPFAVATGNQEHWYRLCRVLGIEHAVDDPRFATNADRVANVDALEEIIEAALSADPAVSWVDRLRAAGVPAGPINDLSEAFATAAALGLEAVAETDGVRTVASPLGLSATPPTVRRRPPGLDEHRDEILAWLKGSLPEVPPQE